MKFITISLVLVCVFGRGTAGDIARTDFIKSFILNEQKPTFVIICDICWSEYDKINVAIAITGIGSGISSSFPHGVKYKDHALLFLVDLDCSQADNVIRLVSSNGLFKRPYRWLVLTNSTEENRLNGLRQSSLLTDSELVLAERTEDSYIMTELHKPSLNHSIISTPRGYYNFSSDVSNATFMDVRPNRSQFRRRMDLMGHTLTMSNVIQDSNKSTYHLPREDGMDFQNDPIAKVSWINAKVAFEMLNATPRYIFSYRWGYRVDGQWSGMINDLNTGRADIGTNCIVSNIDRLSVVAYTDTLAPFKVRFIFRQPPLSYVANIYSLPFSSNLWLGTGACAAISALAIWGAARWERRFTDLMDATQLDGGISDALFWTMSAVSQQGCDMVPRRTPGRIMGWVALTALMALYAAYSANIVVLLQAPSHSVRTLSQLAASKLTLAANDVDYNHFIFKEYKDPVRVTIYKKIEPPKRKANFYDLHEGVEKIRKGLFAFHSIDSQIYRRIEETFTASEKCDLTDIDFMTALDPYAPMKKDSPYLELMRVAFKRMRETGIHTAISRRHHVPKPMCSNKGSAFSSVGLLDLKPVLALMGIGIGASFAVLLAEIAVFKMKQKKSSLEQESRNKLI